MAITTASVSNIERKSSNPYENIDNVINIREDAKLRLQLKTKAMLDELKNESDKTYFQQKYDELLDTEKYDISKEETQPKLNTLKSEIEKKYESLSGAKKTVQEINDLIENKLKSLEMKFSGIDSAAEFSFDNWVVANTNKFSDLNDLETAFNSDFLPSLDKLLASYESQELNETLKNYRFELRNIGSDVFTKGTNNPVYSQETGVEFKVNTAKIKRQKENPFQYAMISEDEIKTSVVDNYKRKGKDRKKALQNILDELEPNTKKGINRINDDEFVAALKKILDPDFLSGIEDVAGAKTGIIEGNDKYETRYKNEDYRDAFRKEFKKEFRKQFIETGKYEKSGINMLQRSETGRIADIVLAYQKGDPNSELAQDLRRLMSAEGLDVHYTGEWNAEYLLKKKVDVDTTFKFLCDFNSDGKVDSTKEGGDFGAVMGLQLYENLLDAGTKEYDADKKEYKLIDGKDTSRLIEHILLSVTSRDAIDSTLKKSIEYFLAPESKELLYDVKDENDEKKMAHKKVALNTGRDAEGNISIENFLNFMKGDFVFKQDASDDEQKAIDEKLKTTAGYDIKEYLRMHGDKLNVERDVSEVFLNPEDIAKRTLEATNDFNEGMESIKNGYRPIIANEQIEKSNVNRSEVKAGLVKAGLEKFSDSDIAEAKNRIGDKMAILAMTITDHIFFNLGYNTAAWIDMFGGAFGAISQTWFKDKESITRNKREIKNALGQYILKRMMPNISLSAARNADGNFCPVIGVGVSIDRFVTGKEGKSNRRGAGINSGFLLDLAKLNEAKFIFSVGAEKGRQTGKNKASIDDLARKHLVPVKRIGIQGGLGFSFKSLKDLSPYVGVFCERDPISGIRESEEVYQNEMDKILYEEGADFNIFAPEQEEKGLPIYKDKGSFANAMKAKIETNNSNKQFLEEEIDQLADIMERGGTFLLMKRTDLDDKTKRDVLRYIYTAYVEGAKENTSAQKTNTVDKQFRLTRIGAKFDIRTITKIVSAGLAGAGAGSIVAPGFGSVIGTILGATAGSLEATRYENDRRYNVDKGLSNYKTIGNMHALKDKDENREDIGSYAKSLEYEVNGRLKYLSVTGEEKENKGTITFSKDAEVKGKDDVLQYMNVYYSDEALASGAFSYDGTSLTLGQSEFSTYKVINKDTDEIFLMIGNNKNGPLKQLTSADKNIARPAIKNLEKVPTKSLPMTKEKMSTLKATLPEGGDQATLDALNNAYLKSDFLKNFAEIDLVNGQIIATRNPNGTFSFKLEKFGPDMNATNNKVELIYEQKISKMENGTSKVFDASKEDLVTFDGELLKAKELIDAMNIKASANLEKIANTDNASLKKEFEKFMEATLQEKIPAAKASLLKLLKSEKSVADVYNFLDKVSDEKIGSYIIDRFVAIFAYENKYGKDIIWATLNERTGDSFRTLKGPSGELLDKDVADEMKTLRNRYRDRDTHKKIRYGEVAKEAVNNIVGYTGFYRTNLQNKAHGYLLMSVGSTNILGDSISEIKNQETAKSWIIKNLRKEEPEKALLLQNIKNKLPSGYANLLTEDKMFELLQSGETEIGGNKKITMESAAFFYLMAECINESVGLRIHKITVEGENTNMIEGTISYQGEVIPGASKMAYRQKGGNGTLNSSYYKRTSETSVTLTGVVGKRRDRRTKTARDNPGLGDQPGGNGGLDTGDIISGQGYLNNGGQ